MTESALPIGPVSPVRANLTSKGVRECPAARGQSCLGWLRLQAAYLLGLPALPAVISFAFVISPPITLHFFSKGKERRGLGRCQVPYHSPREGRTMIIYKRVGARVGLMGNPSDGFGGKTLATLISDFSASVVLWESPKIEILPHPLFDPMCFGSLEDLASTASFDGYYGGLRLVYAACKKFYQWCVEAGVKLKRHNFSIQYDTTIPRQVGLAGSSAIVTAIVKGLMELHELTEDDVPLSLQPSLVLSVETEELGISAGLQDRVVQVYGGLVYMDFDRDYIAEHGHGRYERLDLSLLPPLYLAYTPEPSDSGKIHSTVRYRFDRGEREIVEGMRRLGELTDASREALEARDYETLSRLMDENFDVRRRMYGDEALGQTNLRMIELARSLGLPAKFPGSGGAIVGMYLDEEQFSRAQQAFTDEGFVFRLIHPTETLPTSEDELQETFDRLQELRLAVRTGVPAGTPKGLKRAVGIGL